MAVENTRDGRRLDQLCLVFKRMAELSGRLIVIGHKEPIGRAQGMAEKLAIDGGHKAVTNDLTGWPRFDVKAIKAVQEVIRSGKVNYWTGPKGMKFDRKFAAWQDSK